MVFFQNRRDDTAHFFTFIRMRSPVAWLRIGIFMLVIAARMVAQEQGAPDLVAIVEAGTKTAERLGRQTARWKVRCELKPDQAVVIAVIVDGQRRSETFFMENAGRQLRMLRITEQNNVWQIDEPTIRRKVRPYEATTQVPGTYLFKLAAEAMCLVDPSALAGLRFEARANGILTYRVPFANEARRMVKEALTTFVGAEKENASKLEPLGDGKRLFEEGSTVRVDEALGIVVGRQIQNMTVTLSDFEWLEVAPPTAFPTSSTQSNDTKPWPDPHEWIMMLHDPLATGKASNPRWDGVLVHAFRSELRRLPFKGVISMPLCFLSNRHELLVMGVDIQGRNRLVKLNILTGENTPIASEAFADVIPAAAALAPNGREVAVLGMGAGAEKSREFQMHLLDLESGIVTKLGKPARLGGPHSWLPDGSGLILKRFVPPSLLGNGIEKRVVCRLGRDGVLTDLFSGDEPIVIRHARRILFQKDDDTWQTCNFDGSDSRPYANGMKGYGFPSLSPDEKQIAFMKLDVPGLPELMTFSFGQTDGSRVYTPPGAVSAPKWQ